MQLSRKQVILISVVSGVVLLLIVGAVLIFSPGDAPVEPMPSPAEAVPSTPSPTPAPTPSPTVFRLPLVPQWDTPRPAAEPSGTAGVFVPGTLAPPDAIQSPGTDGPWVGIFDERIKDILAVGLREGRPAALLLLRLEKDVLTVAALPTDVRGPSGEPLEDTMLIGTDPEEQGAHAAALVQAATGLGYGAWLALDLACLPAVLKVTGPLASRGSEALTGDGRQRAQDALALMTGAVPYVQRASLLQFPALKRAVGDAFGSNLTNRELWIIFWTLRNGIGVWGLLLPTEDTGAGRRVDPAVCANFFAESS